MAQHRYDLEERLLECDELIRIFVASIRTAEKRRCPPGSSEFGVGCWTFAVVCLQRRVIYTHVVRELRTPVASPLDQLLAGEAEMTRSFSHAPAQFPHSTRSPVTLYGMTPAWSRCRRVSG